MKKFFSFLNNKRCCKNHDYNRVVEKSNVLQLDDMGYPLRLFIVKCNKCESTTQMWIDVNEEELKELDTGKSVLLKWK